MIINNQLNFCPGLHGPLSDDRVLWQASDIHRDGKHDGGKKTCWGWYSLMTTMVISLWSLWSSRFPWLVSTQPEACIGLQSGGTTICMWAQFKSQRLWQNQDPVKIFLSVVTTRCIQVQNLNSYGRSDFQHCHQNHHQGYHLHQNCHHNLVQLRIEEIVPLRPTLLQNQSFSISQVQYLISIEY